MTLKTMAANTVRVTHSGEEVGTVYLHATDRNHHVMLWASSLAQNWIGGNNWLRWELSKGLETKLNPTGTFFTISRSEEAVITSELVGKLAMQGIASEGLLRSTDFVREVMDIALSGKRNPYNPDVVRLVREYLEYYVG